MGVNRIAIRRAKPTDGRAVAELLGGLGKDFRTTPVKAARRLRTTTDTVFLAMSAQDPVGLVAVNTCRPVHAGHRYGRIMSIVVRQDMKRHGVGRAMMRFALAHLRRLGCRKIELTSRVYRSGAHRFYRAMGFAATSVRFSRTLGR